MSDLFFTPNRPSDANNQGPWNPNQNSFADGSGIDRALYCASEAGQANFGPGNVLNFKAGDYLQYRDSTAKYRKIAAAAGLDLTTSQTAATYDASAGELVQVDTGINQVNLILPPNPEIGDRVGVLKISALEADPCVIDGGSNSVISPTSVALASTAVPLFEQWAVVVWQWQGAHWVPINASRVAGGYEIYQATPIASIGVTDPILWSHVPLFPGDQPLAFSIGAGGVLTSNIKGAVTLEVQGEWTFSLVSNNSDVELILAETYTGSGAVYWPRIIKSFAHSRSGFFTDSGGSSGLANLAAGDTLQFLATGNSGDASFAALDELVLIVRSQ